ncbi:MAG: hypothetical protein JWQ38_856 [Flavipsychrobacter sp.]|nr:hypothetical protein [Flavipsychrobacter sp.]
MEIYIQAANLQVLWTLTRVRALTTLQVTEKMIYTWHAMLRPVVFLWGFSLGGAEYDALRAMTVDAASNVVIGGYIQSGGIDFNPKAGVAILPYAGGTGLTYYGDGFVAKYSSTGVYQWAYGLGGFAIFDHVDGLATDTANNIYLAGEFDYTMVIPGGPTLNSLTDGQGYMIKYTPAGAVVWGHNFGLPGGAFTDTEPGAIKVSNGYIYVAGVFQGNADFDPWGVHHTLSSVGYYDAFIAKYDVNGNCVFANAISGTGYHEQVLGLDLDAADNIYVTGTTNSAKLIFDSYSPLTSSFTTPGGGTSNYDIFMAKYDKNGVYVWGNVPGSITADWGWGVNVINSNVYFTGSFSGTVDFDPSTGTSNLVSNGGTDAFIAKYTLDGNYVCGFSIGDAATDDVGYALSHDPSNYLYACGEFGGTAVDFDPSGIVLPLTSNGNNDGYLAKYDYSNGIITGYVTGDTICENDPAYLSVFITSGLSGPVDVNFTDGITLFTKTGAISGVPFTISPNPTVTTVYTITAAYASTPALCTIPTGTAFGTATVVVYPRAATLTVSAGDCNVFSFDATGNAISGNIFFGDSTTSSIVPVTHSYTAAGAYKVLYTGITADGCAVSDSVVITSRALPDVHIGKDTTICSGDSVTISSDKTYPSSATYLWSTESTATSINVSSENLYWLKVDERGCVATDTVLITTAPVPVVELGNNKQICPGESLVLTSEQPATAIFLWSNDSTGTAITVKKEGTYALTVTLAICNRSDTIVITKINPPVINFGRDTTLCFGEELMLNIEVKNNSVVWSNGTPGPTVQINEPGRYWASLSNKCGAVSDTVDILFEHCNIWFPNAFTPNRDGKNDIARALGTFDKLQDYSLSIYNRLGQQLFYTQDIYAGWNGMYNGTPQDIDVYYYYIVYTLNGKNGMLKGDITLIR